MSMKPRDRISPLLDQARRLSLTGSAALSEAEAPITAERIEHAMVLLAFIMTSTGQARLAPLLDRLERELAVYKHARDPLSRARRILADHTVEGTGKAIRCSHLAFCSSM